MYVLERGEQVLLVHIVQVQHVIFLDCLCYPFIQPGDIRSGCHFIKISGDTVAVSYTSRKHFPEKVEPVDDVLRRKDRIPEILIHCTYGYRFLLSGQGQCECLSARVLPFEVFHGKTL